MIARIWRAWTTPQNGDRFETYLRDQVFPAIRRGAFAGFEGVDLLRRRTGGEDEFVTILWFTTLEAVRMFAGDDYERAIVADEDRALVARFDERVAHYELISTPSGQG
jgi:heme-degrading monooxygenase HmoA